MDEALWALGRGTGITALLMLTVSVVLGVAARSGRPMLWLPRFAIAEVHRFAALLATTLVAMHVALLMADPYAQLRLIDVVIPFLSAYRPVWLGMGTLGCDVLVAVVVTGLLRHTVGAAVFRWVHWATYALWPVALVHGLGSGTDVTTWWLTSIAVYCAVAVVAAIVWRLSARFTEFKTAQIRVRR